MSESALKLDETLRKYGFDAIDRAKWRTSEPAPQVHGRAVWQEERDRPQLEISVTGHDEEEGHTWYAAACSLALGDGETLRWSARRRLALYRSSLYEPIEKEMGEEYAERFAEWPFALRGGLPGTTERLNGWCGCLARCVNDNSASPRVVGIVLEFFEPPPPPSLANSMWSSIADCVRAQSTVSPPTDRDQAHENSPREKAREANDSSIQGGGYSNNAMPPLMAEDRRISVTFTPLLGDCEISPADPSWSSKASELAVQAVFAGCEVVSMQVDPSWSIDALTLAIDAKVPGRYINQLIYQDRVVQGRQTVVESGIGEGAAIMMLLSAPIFGDFEFSLRTQCDEQGEDRCWKVRLCADGTANYDTKQFLWCDRGTGEYVEHLAGSFRKIPGSNRRQQLELSFQTRGNANQKAQVESNRAYSATIDVAGSRTLCIRGVHEYARRGSRTLMLKPVDT